MRTLESLIPESLRYGANHLAACIGTDARLKDGTLADLRTFGNPTHQYEGGLFIWVNARVTDEKARQLQYLINHPDALQRPAFDTGDEIDMQAARDVLEGLWLISEPFDDWYGDGLTYMLVAIDLPVIPAGFAAYGQE